MARAAVVHAESARRQDARDSAMGKKLRSLRRARDLTMQQVADAARLSKSFISQLENGAAKPSIASLKKICDVLDVRVADLFDTHGAEVLQPPASVFAPENAVPTADLIEARVVTKDRRKKIAWPGSKALSYLLTPDLRRRLEVILTEMEPGETLEHEPYTHEGEEFGLVLSGKYEVTVNGKVYVLEEGDTIYYSCQLPHRMRVLGNKPAVTLWVITPPSF